MGFPNLGALIQYNAQKLGNFKMFWQKKGKIVDDDELETYLQKNANEFEY